jgi:hypothetical protein
MDLYQQGIALPIIVQSMGRTGSALDNAVAEAFHSTLEFELRSRTRFPSKADARREIMEWLEEYNTLRLHFTNGMLSPLEYENGRRRPGAKATTNCAAAGDATPARRTSTPPSKRTRRT